MIFEKLFELVIFLLKSIFIDIQIPMIPENAITVIDEYATYLGTGFAVLNNYCNLPYIFALFAYILVVDLTLDLVNFILWICKKIPLLGVS